MSVRLDSINNPCEIYHILGLQSQIIKPDISIISSCGTILFFCLRSATLSCRQQKHCSCGWLVFPTKDLEENYKFRFNRCNGLYKSILCFNMRIEITLIKTLNFIVLLMLTCHFSSLCLFSRWWCFLKHEKTSEVDLGKGLTLYIFPWRTFALPEVTQSLWVSWFLPF